MVQVSYEKECEKKYPAWQNKTELQNGWQNTMAFANRNGNFANLTFATVTVYQLCRTCIRWFAKLGSAWNWIQRKGFSIAYCYVHTFYIHSQSHTCDYKACRLLMISVYQKTLWDRLVCPTVRPSVRSHHNS